MVTADTAVPFRPDFFPAVLCGRKPLVAVYSIIEEYVITGNVLLIGNGIGLIMGILGFKDLHKGATESWSGSSSSSSSGLKTASFTDSGTLYHLTQDSPYSECDYTDQFGGKWGRDSSGFYRK